MKTIYKQVAQQLKTEVPALRWIDFDTGQLESSERPPVALPCALITISLERTIDITETIQECTGTVRIRLAFDQQMKTDQATPPQHRNTALQPYDVIADVHKALQGFSTEHFDPLSRVRQGKENSRHKLFTYMIDYKVEFDDETADQ